MIIPIFFYVYDWYEAYICDYEAFIQMECLKTDVMKTFINWYLWFKSIWYVILENNTFLDYLLCSKIQHGYLTSVWNRM